MYASLRGILTPPPSKALPVARTVVSSHMVGDALVLDVGTIDDYPLVGYTTPVLGYCRLDQTRLSAETVWEGEMGVGVLNRFRLGAGEAAGVAAVAGLDEFILGRGRLS